MKDHNVNLTIKTSNGAFRLKVPVEILSGDLICDVRSRDELKWKDKHLKTLQMNYSKKRITLKRYFRLFSEVIMQNYQSLAELNMAINKFICDGFGIHTKILKKLGYGYFNSA